MHSSKSSPHPLDLKDLQLHNAGYNLSGSPEEGKNKNWLTPLSSWKTLVAGWERRTCMSPIGSVLHQRSGFSLSTLDRHQQRCLEFYCRIRAIAAALMLLYLDSTTIWRGSAGSAGVKSRLLSIMLWPTYSVMVGLKFIHAEVTHRNPSKGSINFGRNVELEFSHFQVRGNIKREET